MTIFTQDRVGQSFIEQYDAPLSDVLATTVEEALHFSPWSSWRRMNELSAAELGEPTLPPEGSRSPFEQTLESITARREPTSPVVKSDIARARVKDEGLDLQIPDDGIRQEALDILIQRKKEEKRRQDVLARGPSGILPGTARIGTMLAASVLDPINVAASFVPVVGQARYAMALRQAAGALGRAGVRARFGAIEGAVGAALVEPLVYGAATQEQADYDLIDSTLNIAFGTALGGGLHVGAGAVGDALKRGVDWRQVKADQSALAQTVDRLDLQAKEAALRTGVAQAVTGRAIDVEPVVSYAANQNFERPLRAAVGQDFFEVEARIDPTTGVEGFTVFHGSPHTFDRFSMDRIGTGEGAQAFGHGLYFAESANVARQYRDTLGRFAMEVGGKRIEPKPGSPEDTALAHLEEAFLRGSSDPFPSALTNLMVVQERSTPDQQKLFDEAIRVAKEWDAQGAKLVTTGSMYEVRINASPDDFLDWDKPLSEQPEGVRKALEAAGLADDDASVSGPEFFRGFEGSDFGPEEVALLRAHGVKGIRYLDAGSRGAGDGSRNFVVFDDSVITTVRRNDELLLKQPEDLRARAAASFAPESFRLYDTEAIRSAEAKIAEAPADEQMPEVSLEAVMEDVERLSTSLGMEESLKAEMAVYDELAQTADAYGRAVAAAASCRLRRGA